jgi:asparagine synthase (glutamine-hydrolysing)
MCGIAGYCLKKSVLPSGPILDPFIKSVRKRGPNDEGVCLISRKDRCYHFLRTDGTIRPLASLPHIHKEKNFSHDVAFYHSRYAIIDLSEGGHQPFLSQDKSIVANFNGEIYNYLELKNELIALGVKFRTKSDTEVLVEGYRIWKHDLWAKLNGFWAVALYDFNAGSLILSRDRLGVAPLYYRETAEGIYFSSTIEPLIQINNVSSKVNNDVLLGFIQTGLKDLNSSTYYTDIKTVPQATTVELPTPYTSLSMGQHKKYWNLPTSRLSVRDLSFTDATHQLRELLFKSVELRLRADVKVAFELSGGLDSSSIVAIASQLKKGPITTYTAKIKDADEEPIARTILKKYQIDYRIITGIENNFIKDFESFSKIMEEPYDNPNDYTHHMMLKQIKKEGVDVIVTGAGGDEVLAGYESSFWPQAYAQLRKENVSSYLKADWHEFCRRFRTLDNSKKTLKHYLLDPWKYPFKRNSQKKQEQQTQALSYQSQYEGLNFSEQSRFHFEVALLPYYMRSSDHFTMTIPIEHRFPFLDFRVVEFGLRLPAQYLFQNGWTKYILRKAMEPYLPAEIVWRRQKMGFAFPYRSYFGQHQDTFKPLLENFYQKHSEFEHFGLYEQLHTTNPLLLWRLLSTAIWAKQNLK